jgi:hypothetical protein
MAYNQIIEIEYIDKLISSKDTTVIAFLLMLCEELNQDETFKDDFFFEVTKYGFQGYYAAIGVVYLKEITDYYLVNEDLEKQVANCFIELIEKRSVKDLVDFMLDKKKEIDDLFAKINDK